MQGDLEIRELVVSIEAAGRLGRAKRADLHVKITIDGRVSLQKNELVQTTFERYTNGRSTDRVWDVGLKLGEKWLRVETNGERPHQPQRRLEVFKNLFPFQSTLSLRRREVQLTFIQIERRNAATKQ